MCRVPVDRSRAILRAGLGTLGYEDHPKTKDISCTLSEQGSRIRREPDIEDHRAVIIGCEAGNELRGRLGRNSEAERAEMCEVVGTHLIVEGAPS